MCNNVNHNRLQKYPNSIQEAFYCRGMARQKLFVKALTNNGVHLTKRCMRRVCKWVKPTYNLPLLIPHVSSPVSLLLFSLSATQLQFPAKKQHLLVHSHWDGSALSHIKQEEIVAMLELVFQLSVTNFDADCISVMHLRAANWMHCAASHQAKDASP